MSEDLHKPGVLCVNCSPNPEGGWLDRVYHPADRACLARGEASEKGCENYPHTEPGSATDE